MREKTHILVSTFHHGEFRDKGRLVEQKIKQGVKISLAFPTLNEEATIGKEILVLKTELMDRFPLLDEIAVIDSGSADRTREVAGENGARVYSSQDILRKYGSYRGKGENLWKSLYVLTGDIIVWIDADISNIGPKFVTGLVGPLLKEARISYVKAFYERPLRTAGKLEQSGGGRVTEILVRPLFSLFYPELANLIQPLSGEYAGRRAVLERLPFSVGYGVELGHLIDIYHAFGVDVLAQVNMDSRVHRNQSVNALGRMSFGILHTFFNRLEKYGESRLLSRLGGMHISISGVESHYEPVFTEISPVERLPIMELEEYRRKFPRSASN
jgi:glucosyl-3-phosphoglycerate synthase